MPKLTAAKQQVIDAFESGTIAVSFRTDSASQRQTLFSKDHSGYQQGGHITAQIADGRVEARLQSDSAGVTIRSAIDSIRAGEQHHVAVSFGDRGFRLYVDGKIADAEVDFAQSIENNENSLFLGASTKRRDGDKLRLQAPLVGTVDAFAVYDAQFNLAEMAALAGAIEAPLEDLTMIDGVRTGTDRGEMLFGGWTK